METILVSLAKRVGKDIEETAFGQTLAPSGRTAIYFPPLGVDKVLI
jgi:hypothetical protein